MQRISTEEARAAMKRMKSGRVGNKPIHDPALEVLVQYFLVLAPHCGVAVLYSQQKNSRKA